MLLTVLENMPKKKFLMMHKCNIATGMILLKIIFLVLR